MDWTPVIAFLPWSSFGCLTSASSELHHQGYEFASSYFKSVIQGLQSATLGDKAHWLELCRKYLWRNETTIALVEASGS